MLLESSNLDYIGKVKCNRSCYKMWVLFLKGLFVYSFAKLCIICDMKVHF